MRTLIYASIAIWVCFAHFTEAVFVSVSLASDVTAGKEGKKATDEEEKQYGGNGRKDYGGGAEAVKIEIHGQDHYEQNICDDDLSGQISEITEQNLSHRIRELQMEEKEEPDKVAIFAWVKHYHYINSMRNNFRLISIYWL